jgi:NTE family protein
LKNRLINFGRRLRPQPSISLALGGGGSKGSAHLGVLRVLEQENIRIGAVAGSSMGGLIGAVYLAGNSPSAVAERLAGLEQKQLFKRGRDVTNALMGLDGVYQLLHDVIGDRTFADLPVPFAVTAVDLKTGQEIILSEGSLVEAVLATIAIPGMFPTRKMNGYELIDGGISNPVPVAVARSLAPHLPVIASVLTRAPEPDREIPMTQALGSQPLLDRIAQFRLAQAWNVFTRAITISGKLLAELRMGIEKPDLIIRPDVDHIGIMDVVDVHELVTYGEQAAQQAMPELRAILRKRASLYSMLERMTNRG